ncbi:CoxG family protein [Acuticoccus yangtzensis]|uniref:CoxG family protein n=1 Tax=Acuticoccus yangtzensis TaxID=1443441 RepID=UPI000949A678|nr:carbon monoxide dehydrogenase subunit G [Acuticoccus yangtzensis]
MQLTGEHRIPAPRKVVWDALHDPDILKDCIKGCQRLEMKNDHEMVAKVQAKVGPVKATFDADVEIVNAVEPERYTIQGEGKGGVAGFAKGKADVTLTEAADNSDETILAYVVDAKVGGKLAQLGSRLVDNTAKKYAADFFEVLCQKIEAPQPYAIPRSEALTEPPMDPATIHATKGRIEPTRVEEGLVELQEEQGGPFAAPRPEDIIEQRIEAASARRVFGGAWFWGVIAFAAVMLVLVALS